MQMFILAMHLLALRPEYKSVKIALLVDSVNNTRDDVIARSTQDFVVVASGKTPHRMAGPQTD